MRPRIWQADVTAAEFDDNRELPLPQVLCRGGMVAA